MSIENTTTYQYRHNKKLCGGISLQKGIKKSQKDKPLITIITIVFNGEKFLEDAIKSVINQTYDNIEYIIIDGNSKDGTLDIIKKYESKIDLWISEPDEGIYDAMNKGIGLANGEVIGLLNADDYYESDSLEKIQKKHITDSADIYYGNMIVVKQRTKEMIEKRYPNFKKLYFGMYLNHPATFVKKEV